MKTFMFALSLQLTIMFIVFQVYTILNNIINKESSTKIDGWIVKIHPLLITISWSIFYHLNQ